MSLLIIARVIFPLCLCCVFASTMMGKCVGLLKGRKKRSGKKSPDCKRNKYGLVRNASHIGYLRVISLRALASFHSRSIYSRLYMGKQNARSDAKWTLAFASLRGKKAFPEVDCRPERRILREIEGHEKPRITCISIRKIEKKWFERTWWRPTVQARISDTSTDRSVVRTKQTKTHASGIYIWHRAPSIQAWGGEGRAESSSIYLIVKFR